MDEWDGLVNGNQLHKEHTSLDEKVSFGSSVILEDVPKVTGALISRAVCLSGPFTQGAGPLPGGLTGRRSHLKSEAVWSHTHTSKE